MTVIEVMSGLVTVAARYKMGHAYELQIPRGRPEWATSIQIQRDFPPSVGCDLTGIQTNWALRNEQRTELAI